MSTRKMFFFLFVAWMLFCYLPDRVQASEKKSEYLINFLNVDLPGWKAEGKPEQKGNEFTRTFRSGNQVVKININEFIESYGIPYRNRRTPPPAARLFHIAQIMFNGHPINFKGFQASESYDSQKKEGHLFVDIDDQIIIDLYGKQIENIDTLKNMASILNLHKLKAITNKELLKGWST